MLVGGVTTPTIPSDLALAGYGTPNVPAMTQHDVSVGSSTILGPGMSQTNVSAGNGITFRSSVSPPNIPTRNGITLGPSVLPPNVRTGNCNFTRPGMPPAILSVHNGAITGVSIPPGIIPIGNSTFAGSGLPRTIVSADRDDGDGSGAGSSSNAPMFMHTGGRHIAGHNAGIVPFSHGPIGYNHGILGSRGRDAPRLDTNGSVSSFSGGPGIFSNQGNLASYAGGAGPATLNKYVVPEPDLGPLTALACSGCRRRDPRTDIHSISFKVQSESIAFNSQTGSVKLLFDIPLASLIPNAVGSQALVNDGMGSLWQPGGSGPGGNDQNENDSDESDPDESDADENKPKVCLYFAVSYSHPPPLISLWAYNVCCSRRKGLGS
ncbi:hypothetical protein GGS23DRAFT_272126 [Durotheca rogersii]|uniref:uncharacterized protein n=1 Tax=Durotheca rogersii TaxID=419775 RepID=UPI002220F174|nr:uncharacterized protein GGS23DRAFT_272126 [Durotheca rogersii]KAI5866447.1 hypothetical protein GGS23DRAFT_272126 [Durotheca rogersii]